MWLCQRREPENERFESAAISVSLQQVRDPARSSIGLVCAADDAFSMPLATTVRSVLDHLGESRRLRLFVIDGGISDRNKARLLESWGDGRLVVEWLPARLELLEGLANDGRISVASYFRILIPLLLPTDVERVLYLDADLLVRRDIGELWDEPFAGAHCLAVQDIGAPYLDATRVLRNFDRCSAWLAGATPIPNFRELGLPHDARYFNAGVMSLDVARWRADDIANGLLRCLSDNKEHVLWWDQYALNVVLCGKWQVLDPRWNQMSRIFKFPSWEQSPVDEMTFQAIKDDPYIVHFSSIPKPWQARCRHPRREEYLACLDRTAWAGHRPRRWDAAKAWSSQQCAWVESGGRHLYRGARRLAGR
jgi:lipopolysaccharide biosynthesis glycosyltransferase